MKKYIILIIIFVLLLSFGIFIAYKVGFKQGYNHTVPAVEIAFEKGLIKDITKGDVDILSNWLKTSRSRDFGNYYLYKPNDDTIDALWIVPKDKPYSPVVMIEDKGESIVIHDKKENSIHIDYDNKKNRLSSLCYFFDGGSLTDFNLNGTEDFRSTRQKNGFLGEIQIDSVWYEFTTQKNKIQGKKDYMYINTKDGKKEVDRDGGDYYIKSEQD